MIQASTAFGGEIMSFQPKYTLTETMAENLVEIKKLVASFSRLTLSERVLEELKVKALTETVILSTKIEGNLLADKDKLRALKSPNENKRYTTWRKLSNF